ncbi:hypothetical protein BKI52_38665 [marine bacterium AO1-C]|nr:hypothetical protein BKI52_38665 [marine bacterium AO1-C]
MDKYHDFKVEDFAEDPYFYAWVASPDSENEQFWNEWIEKHPEKYAVITEARTILLSVIEVNEDEVPTERVSQLWNQIEEGIEALDKYQQYSAEDFADDPSFFTWVTEPDEATKTFWHNWLKLNPEKHNIIEEAKSLIGMLQLKEADIPQSTIDNLWNKIDTRIENLWGEIESGINAIDQYSDFTAEDFANDPSFFAWVTEPDEALQTHWNTYLKQNPEKTSTVDEAKRLIGLIQVKEEDDIPQSKIDDLWNRIDSRIGDLWSNIESGMEAIDQYSDFTAEDFANDPSFFAWVTTPDETTNKHWEVYQEQNPEKASLIDEAKRLIGLIQVKEEDDIPQNRIDDLWNRIDSRIDNLWSNIESGIEAIDQYKDYTANDFADDPSFFVWVTEPDEASEHHWTTYLEQNPEKVSVIEDARLLVLDLNLKIEIPQTRIDNLWEQIDQGIQQGGGKKTSDTKTRSLSLRRFYAVAASVIILIGAFFIIRNFNQGPTVEMTAMGEQKKVELPDGSTATLNADSRISYQSSDWKQERNLKLSGEAFFEVKKGSKFEVETNKGTVAVLGTSFNVFDRNNALKVECVTGKVKLTGKLGSAVQILEPGMGAKIDQGKLSKYSFDKTEASKWTSGEFNYTETSLPQVFAEVTRQFNVRFEYKTDIKDKLYTGGFSNKEDLAAALQFICEPMNLKYTIQTNGTKTVVIDVKDKK